MNLDQLWQNTNEKAPDWQAFAKQVAALEIKKRNEKNRLNFLLLSTMAFVGFIAFAYLPLSWTTLVGIVLTELSMLLYLWQYNRHTTVRNITTETSNARAYLEWLYEDRKRQRYLGRQLMSAYFLLLSTGVLVYMWEFVQRMPGFYGWLAYGITLGWFALNWFVFRPRIIQKREAALNDLIQQLERLQQQWAD
jgi:heme exporter protein D